MRQPSAEFTQPVRDECLLAWAEACKREGKNVAVAIIVGEQMQERIEEAHDGDGWWFAVTCMDVSISPEVRLAYHELIERHAIKSVVAHTVLQARIGRYRRGHGRAKKTRRTLESTSLVWEALFMDSTRRNAEAFQLISLPINTTTHGECISSPMIDIGPGLADTRSGGYKTEGVRACFKIVASQDNFTKFYQAVEPCGRVWEMLKTKSRLVPGIDCFASYIILNFGFGSDPHAMRAELAFNHLISQYVYGRY
jgi:hypothetical protein